MISTKNAAAINEKLKLRTRAEMLISQDSFDLLIINSPGMSDAWFHAFDNFLNLFMYSYPFYVNVRNSENLSHFKRIFSLQKKTTPENVAKSLNVLHPLRKARLSC